MDRPKPVLLAYNPNHKLDDAARDKLVEEQAARMKATITARRKREAEAKLEAEREQRRKAFAPHWDDSSDDESDASMDVSSPELPLGFAEKSSIPTDSKSASHPSRNISTLSIDTQKKRLHDAISVAPSFEQPSSVPSPESPISPKDISLGPGLASLPRISKRRKTSVSAQVSPASNISTVQNLAGQNLAGQNLGVPPLPEWYLTAVMPKGPSKETMSAFRRIWTQFDKLKENMKICITATDPQARTEPLKKISELLHTLEFTKIPHPYSLTGKKILHDRQGLRRIADEQDSAYNFPWYLRADAQELYNKWLSREWDPDMFRGITNMVKGPNGSKGQSIDPKYKKDWRFFGEGHFVAGQWWPMQLCAVRDGAHGSVQAGIAGIKTTEGSLGGATSIVLSEGHKEDIDEGHEIWYCGTEAKIGDTEPTASTKLMLESLSSNLSVRVMRSSKLPAGNKYRPVKGFRYDGLYEVLSSQIELRCEGEAARPTPKELQEYENEMKKYGRRGSFD
ncbi:hypothetical protein EG328_003628 [Venturia inaequalis]|uniref:YDG domain-containing protein n=1 Tax=Venturia inaequalis TaxID=5025 RepID=A0A8H3Z6G7_VENIN|nr:hypothetical protein EG328_003628 [Venturia inaequalis]KAE9993077.1 hypothetical protein EG327_006607 [Venturia inaequalis]